MPAIRSAVNQFLGVNPHLHSHFQDKGGWDEFHTKHIADMFTLLRAQLLPMGYTAGMEQSLQIRRLGEPIARPESDVTIYDTDPTRAYESITYAKGDTHVLIQTLPDILTLVDDDLAHYRAIAIYETDPHRGDRGEPVAWIELLSPSNKPGGQDANIYRNKRLTLLRSGIVFIEIDYLHESAPTFEGLPHYRLHESDAPSDIETYPYRIVVIDPRPEFIKGQARTTQFEVDMPIPLVEIPLNGGDKLSFDFDRAYRKTYEESLYGLEFVDYRQLPANFARYSQADQARILMRMIAIIKMHNHGDDLEQLSHPIDALTLEDALQQFEQLKKG